MANDTVLTFRLTSQPLSYSPLKGALLLKLFVEMKMK